MAFIRLTTVVFSEPISQPITVTVRYRDAATLDLGSNYTVAGTTIVQPDGSISPFFDITGLDEGKSYIVQFIPDCGNTVTSKFTIGPACDEVVIKYQFTDTTNPIFDEWDLQIWKGTVEVVAAHNSQSGTLTYTDAAGEIISARVTYPVTIEQAFLEKYLYIEDETTGEVIYEITTNDDSEDAAFGMFIAENCHVYKIIASVREVSCEDVASVSAAFAQDYITNNDSIANAYTISGSSGTVLGDTTGFTNESFEPANNGNTGYKTAWFKFTPNLGGKYTFNTKGTGLDTILSIGTWNGSAFTVTAYNDGWIGYGDGFRASFLEELSLSTGTTYYIRVAGYNGASGKYNLNWIRSL